MVSMGTPSDGFRPARLTIGIISAGRVGTALGVALERAEHVVVACSAISHASRERAQRRLPDTAVLPVDEVAARAELLLLAVPDAALPGLISGLAATGAVRPGHDRRAYIGGQRHRCAGATDRTGLHSARDSPGDDVHRGRRGHRPPARGVLRGDRGRRSRIRDRAVAGAGDRRRTVPHPRRRANPLSRGAGACEQSPRHRGARRGRGTALCAVGSGVARAGDCRQRTRRHCRAGHRSAGTCIAGKCVGARTGCADRTGRPRRRRRGRGPSGGAHRVGSPTRTSISRQFLAHGPACTRPR